MRLLTAVLLLLAIAPAAEAQSLPPAGITVGGGAAPGGGKLGGLISMRVGGDGRTVRIAGSLATRCARRVTFSRFFAGSGRLADDGSFDLTLPGRKPDGPVYREGRGDVRVTGTFDGARASGSMILAPGARARTGRRRSRPCPGTANPFEVRDPGRPTGRSTVVTPGQVLYGLSSTRRDGVRVGALVRTAATGRRLQTVFAGLDLRCEGEPATVNNFSPSVPVRDTGAFRLRERFRIPYSNAVSRYTVVTAGHYAEGGGITGRITAAIRGRFTSGPAKGERYRCRRAGTATYAVIP